MYSEIVDYIKNVCNKHVAVKSAKYQNSSLINQQGNNPYVQVIVESNGVYAQWLKTSNVFTMTFNIDFLGFVDRGGNSELDVHNLTFQIANEVLAYIDGDFSMKQFISIWDYDLLSLSHFSNDNTSGWRLSLELVVPTPIDLCNMYDNFDEDKMEVEDEKELDLVNPNPESKSNELQLKPVKLPRNAK